MSAPTFENVDLTVALYPNPTSSNYINVNVMNLDQDKEVVLTIYNMVGAKMYSQKITFSPGSAVQIDLNDNFSNGIYFMEAMLDGKRTVQKFVVQK